MRLLHFPRIIFDRADGRNRLTLSFLYPLTKITTEDRAVEVTCDAMGWEVPKYWRAVRQKLATLHGMPLLDLAVWDKNYHERLRKRQRRGGHGGYDDTTNSDCSNDNNVNVDGDGTYTESAPDENYDTVMTNKVAPVTDSTTSAENANECVYDRQEEKKDCSTEEHQCQC